MNNELFKQWNDWAQSAWKPFMELGEITTRAVERNTQQQLEILNECVNGGLKNAQDSLGVKHGQELLALQNRFFSECGEKVNGQLRQGLDNYLQTSAELNQWLEKQMKAQNKPATKKAA